MKSFLYSPFSSTIVVEKNNNILLLLFILKELANSHDGIDHSTPLSNGPFDWAGKATSLQKLREHFSLLPFAFPQLAHLIPSLEQPTQEIINGLEPFILACAENENLLLFLVQHQKELAVKPILDKICPEGLDAIKEKIAAGFRKRGYPFTKWTLSSKTP